MREHIVDATHVELLCGEAAQSLIVDINFQRTDRSDQNVDTQIPLVPADQIRVRQITLNNNLCAVVQFGNALQQVDASSPRGSAGFADPYAFLVILVHKSVYESRVLVWQDESHWKDVE